MTRVILSAVTPHLVVYVSLSPACMAGVKSSGVAIVGKTRKPTMVTGLSHASLTGQT